MSTIYTGAGSNASHIAYAGDTARSKITLSVGVAGLDIYMYGLSSTVWYITGTVTTNSIISIAAQ